MLQNAKSSKPVLYVVIVLWALVWLLPIVLMLLCSLSPAELGLGKLGGLIIETANFSNYITVMKRSPIGINFINSGIITITTVFLVVTMASLAAYAFARLKFIGRDIFYYLLLFTLMLPIAALVIPLFQINKSLHLNNTYAGLILPYVALGVPFAVIILRSFFSIFPKEIEEAALMDGCNRFQIYWSIMMPVSWSALSVVIIWQFMTSWNEFLLALITIKNNDLKPITLVPMLYQGHYRSSPNDLFAILSLMTVPIIIVFILMQRSFVSGMTGGALKG